VKQLYCINNSNDCAPVYVVTASADEAIAIWRETAECPPTVVRSEHQPANIYIYPLLNGDRL